MKKLSFNTGVLLYFCWSDLLFESRVAEHVEIGGATKIVEMFQGALSSHQIGLAGWIPISELDAVFIFGDLEHLYIHSGWLLRRSQDSREVESQLGAGNAIFDLFLVQVGDEISEVLQRTARSEELGEVLHEARSILLHLE